MKRKALKNIPKPDEEKLALFYEKTPDPQKKSTVVKPAPVDTKPTVEKMSTVVNEDFLIEKLRPLTTFSQLFVYLSLYKSALSYGQETTNWVGYGNLSKDLQISTKTVQRAIEKLIDMNLKKPVYNFKSNFFLILFFL